MWHTTEIKFIFWPRPTQIFVGQRQNRSGVTILFLRFLPAMLVLTFQVAKAQNDIHSCEAAPEIQRIYTPVRNSPDRVKVFREALKAHPDDIALNRWLLSSKQLPPGTFVEEYRRKLDNHPGTPLYLYFYGHAVIGTDTVKAIALINEAVEKDPDIVLAYLTLMEIYTSQAFRDANKLTAALQSYVTRCPQDVSIYKYLREVQDLQVVRALAPKFRYAVEHRNSVGVTRTYINLWSAEFRVADPRDFGKLREQVRVDMKRIRELDSNIAEDDRALLEGYRLLGEQAKVDQLQKSTTRPKGFNDVFQAWNQAHPWPKEDGLEQTQHTHQMLEASEQWVKDWPDEANAWAWRIQALAWLKGTTAKEIEAAGEQVLQVDRLHSEGWSSHTYASWVAEIWLNRDVRLNDVVLLAREARSIIDKGPAGRDDRYSAAMPAAMQYNAALDRMKTYVIEGEALLKLKDLESTRQIVAEMKRVYVNLPGSYTGARMMYHDLAAKLAHREGHKLDALSEYQQAFHSNENKQQASELWTELGGSADYFDGWWKAVDPVKTPVSADVSVPALWTKKDQPLLGLKAKDLGGNSWTITNLKGKTTLINVWATWCGPCREELPYVQKLYDKVKDRDDVQVITISVDSNPGIIGPFLDRQHYTFPVVLAKGLVDELVPEFAIPRNWIVDNKGSLRFEGVGFTSGPEWQDNTLKKMAELK